jgi:hypothetical protein
MLFRFPFFTIYRDSQSVLNPLMPQHALTFSSVEKATGFMQQRGITDWEFKVINRFNLHEFTDDLRRQGLTGVCYDPDSDGSGGESVSIEELAK